MKPALRVMRTRGRQQGELGADFTALGILLAYEAEVSYCTVAALEGESCFTHMLFEQCLRT